MELTPVRRSGRTSRFGVPAVFGLPQALQNGPTAENARGLAVFAKKCLQDAALEGRPVVFCLDAVTKEYQHLPVRHADLLKLARLEAETVLPENAEHYVVGNDPYGGTDSLTGRTKSVLYAVPDRLIRNILKEFRQIGIRVVKISPPVSGLMNAAKTALRLKPGNPAFSGETAAVVDAGKEKLRLLLFSGGSPVFQKEFDSVYGELLEILEREEGFSREEAEREVVRPGFLLTAGRQRLRPAASESVSLLIETAVGEVIRNTRVVLSSERLELGRIFFCGSFSSHPDFRQYIENLGLGVPFENVESACGAGLGIALEPQAAVEGLHPADFFTLNGLISGGKTGCVDFLCEENSRRGSRRAGFLVLTVLTAAAAAAMALQPFLYRAALDRQAQDRAALSSPSYREAKDALDRQSSLNAKLKAAQKDRDVLPSGSSAEIYGEIQKEVAGRVTKISQCSVNYADGSVFLSFTVPGLTEFAAVRDGVSSAGYFTVEIPFTAAWDPGENGYLCTTVLKAKDYRPYGPETGKQESAASDGKAATAG